VVGLTVAGAISRWCGLGALVTLPYARADGLGVAWSGGHRLLDAIIGTIVVLPFVWLGGVKAVLGVVVAAVGAVLLSAFAQKRVGGATGDIYGAVVEVCQLLVLVALVVRL
jgi:adenosylcobinamide-GDP ribazoletransferase